ncbi:hypothetical protein GCM10009841_35340 [Microlunatus panaciterrae]|uniref:DUF2157 domain-containing protein n=1 Tax=Microlunatus panaciterrae TaxID=400768 RepID=A0ABS2RGR4_9ACTN|nr:DUF2157 domain-containing protein [Microlunatus panaciterrae]MBM7798191.1 hypothetical protein [Microlunatus panaciterrae]
MSRLSTEIHHLVEDRTLSSAQGDLLLHAAQEDLREATGAVPATPDQTATEHAAARRNAVLEVLGYVGGALLLGAIIFLCFLFWGDLGRAGRNLVAVAAVVVAIGGGLALVGLKVRQELGHVLIALGCYALGFAYFNLFTDRDGIASSAVIVLASVVGAVVFRSGAFLFTFWSGSILLAIMLLNYWNADDIASMNLLGSGFLGLAAVLGASGFLLAKPFAWSLAGISGWASGWVWYIKSDGGTWLALTVATVVAALLLLAFVRIRNYALAIIGCLVILSLWPACLYRIVGSAFGVAIGLIAAGAVLIGIVIVLSRRSRTQIRPGTAPHPLPR